MCKTAVDWVNRIVAIVMKIIITFTFCCHSLWRSKFMAQEKLGKLRPPCLIDWYCDMIGSTELLCPAVLVSAAVVLCRSSEIHVVICSRYLPPVSVPSVL